MRPIDELIRSTTVMAEPDILPQSLAFHYPAHSVAMTKEDGDVHPLQLFKAYRTVERLSRRIFRAFGDAVEACDRLGYTATNEKVAFAFEKQFDLNMVEDVLKASMAVHGLRLSGINNIGTYFVAGPMKALTQVEIPIVTDIDQRWAHLSIALQRDLAGDEAFFNANIADLTEDDQMHAFSDSLIDLSPAQFFFSQPRQNALFQCDHPVHTDMRRADGYELCDEDITTFVAHLCNAPEKVVLDTTTEVKTFVLPHPSGLPQIIEVRKNMRAQRAVLYPAMHDVVEKLIDAPEAE